MKRSIYRTLGPSLRRTIALICATVVAVAVSYGATAVSDGMPVWLPLVMGASILAGGAELLFVGIVASGGSPLMALAAGLLVNARHVSYGLSLPEVSRPGWRRLAAAHLLNDETTALGLAVENDALRRIAYWTCGAGIVLGWPLGAFAGGLLVRIVPHPDAFGLDAMFPAVLLALILPMLRRSPAATSGAVATGAVIALAATPLLPAGLPVLLSLAGLGVAVADARRHRDRSDA